MCIRSPTRGSGQTASLSDKTNTGDFPGTTDSESGIIDWYRQTTRSLWVRTVRQIRRENHCQEKALNPGLIIGLSVSPLIVISGVGALAVIAFVAILGVVRVSDGELAVATVAGGASRVLTPGTHLVPPVISRIHRYDARMQKLDCAGIETRNLDGTPVNADVIVEFVIEDVETVFRSVEDHEAVVIRQTEGCVLDILAAADDGTITMSQRRLALDIRDALAESLNEIGLRVDSVELSAQITENASENTPKSNHPN